MSTDHTIGIHHGTGDDHPKPRARHGRARAFLAGGLVLGVGAAVTLAAWTDNVNAHGDFATGAWNVQGNVSSPFANGTSDANWQEYSTGTGGALAFVVNPTNLTPGDTVYAPIALRVDPTKNSNPASVTLNGATTSGSTVLMSALTYAAKSGVSAATCNAANFAANGTSLVPAATALTTGSGSTAFTLAADSTPVSVCFAVTLPSSATTVQSLSGQAVWTFAASSS
jgi:predicted ribosomally synthesized peptide with SipW-like signal peptide